MTDFFTTGPIDPRIYKELATDMWRETVSYLPVKDVLKLPNLCKYLNEEVVWHKHSGRLMWGEMAPGAIDELVFQRWRGENPPSQTALICACYRGAPVAHVSALADGANVNAVDSFGRTPLYLASCGGYEDIVRVLLGANADPNVADNDGWTPLIIASHYGYPAVVAALLEGGKDGVGLKFNCANVNHANNFTGRTALMAACANTRVDCVRVLVNARADVTMRNNQGETALDMARHNVYIEIIRILEEAQT